MADPHSNTVIGVVLPFRRRRHGTESERSPAAPPALTLAARGGAVTLGALDVEIELSPLGARELARDLLELADDADGSASER